MKTIRTLIVDDEASNREILVQMMQRSQLNFQVVGEADNIAKAQDLMARLKPDLLLLDIQMPGGSSFQILEAEMVMMPEVVFVTAYDEYAIKAFEYNALDYLLKPIDEQKFVRMLLKVKERMDAKIPQELILQEAHAIYSDAGNNKIPVHEGRQVRLLRLEDMLCILSKEGCTEFVMKPGSRHMSSKQLSDFEYIFAKWPFLIRINKSTYVNANEIKSYSKGMSCDITLSDGTVFEISRRKKSSVLEAIRRLM